MGIFDGIENDGKRGPLCSVHALIGKLDKADREALDRVLVDSGIPASLIAARLRGAGHRVGDDALRRHRRGLCACPRS